jgi:serine/threonine protein kinase
MTFQDPWYIYLVMEYASAGDTFSLIQSDSPKFNDFKNLGEIAVRFIAGCVILGLELLHKNNYIYRDLKP